MGAAWEDTSEEEGGANSLSKVLLCGSADGTFIWSVDISAHRDRERM